MNEVPTGWSDYLEPGERILWEGRPDGGVSCRGLDPKRTLFGLFFTAFALFWTLAAAANSNPRDGLLATFFPLFGLLFIWQGLRMAGATRLLDAFRRRHSWYTLTNRRAFIATDMFGRRDLQTWPIGSDSVLTLDEGPPDSVWFAERPGRRGRPRRPQPVGFERIADGGEVLRLMRQVQREMT